MYKEILATIFKNLCSCSYQSHKEEKNGKFETMDPWGDGRYNPGGADSSVG
jgi:hypothetical protein